MYGPDDGELPGRVPVHAWAVRVDVPLEALDDAHVRRASAPRADTNRRFHELLAAGGDGLSTAFDLPTLMGRDSDDPLALGEVGKCGVAVDTLADMEDLFRGIDLGDGHHVDDDQRARPRSCSRCTSRRPSARGVERARSAARSRTTSSRSTRRRRSSSSRRARRCGSSPTRSAFCAAEMPRWHPISISGYHIREAGSTAAQELAFTLANGFAYVEAAHRAPGSTVDEFAPRLSFFFNAHIDFFEEIAKYRAARRIWARWMRDRYGADGRAVAAAAVPHPDRRACRSPRSSPRSTSSAPRSRRSPACSAARRACTPTRWTRRSRCPTREGGPHRAADPAGDRLRDRASPTSPTRSVARGTSRRSPTRWSAQAEEVFAHLDGLGDGSHARGRARAASRRAGSRARSPTPPTTSSASSTTAATSWSGVNVATRGQRRAPPEILRIGPEVEEAQLQAARHA